MEMLGAPALIFALGMYLPLELNTPALVGGFLAHFLSKRGAADARAGRDHRLGLMAGGALGGVFGAALRLFPVSRRIGSGRRSTTTKCCRQSISALLFVGLCAYLWWGSQRSREENRI